MSSKQFILAAILALFLNRGALAEDAERKPSPETSAWLLAAPDAGVGFSLITYWGIDHWNWFQQPFHRVDEHGFSNRSKTGGSDKTGHFLSAYLMTELLGARLLAGDVAAQPAALTASAYAAALMTWIEVGDATSRYGFSNEDLLADYLGVGMSYLLQTKPALRAVLDLRLEYWPSIGHEKNSDLVADYSGMKHLAALKFSGFDWAQQNALRYFELQAGYYSRGYRSFDRVHRERVLYTAIGINLSHLLQPLDVPSAQRALQYIQVPYTYVPYKVYSSNPGGNQRGTLE